jgi:hypothetical protein
LQFSGICNAIVDELWIMECEGQIIISISMKGARKEIEIRGIGLKKKFFIF